MNLYVVIIISQTRFFSFPYCNIVSEMSHDKNSHDKRNSDFIPKLLHAKLVLLTGKSFRMLFNSSHSYYLLNLRYDVTCETQKSI